MKTYEEYLLTEKVSAGKMLKRIKNHLKNATTPAEMQVGMALAVTFIKKFGDYWTDEVSKEVDGLARDAKKRIAAS